MKSLHLVQYQPRWRVALVARFAQLMGVLIHVEGFPFGSARLDTSRGEASGAEGPAGSLHQGTSGQAARQIET